MQDRLADTVRNGYCYRMMFADETPEEIDRSDAMLRRRGYSQDEIDLMRDYE